MLYLFSTNNQLHNRHYLGCTLKQQERSDGGWEEAGSWGEAASWEAKHLGEPLASAQRETQEPQLQRTQKHKNNANARAGVLGGQPTGSRELCA